MDELETLDLDQMAKLFKLSPETIKGKLYRDPENFPPRMRGTSEFVWLKSQVVAWLNLNSQPELQQLKRMEKA